MKPIEVTLEQLRYIFPETTVAVLSGVLPHLKEMLPKYGITTKLRVAAFLAQVGHESGGFRYRIENLNYSADALLRVFPKYFNRTLANEYARNPVSIASRVYANRMGNGNEASQDGWKFRGRGYVMITGKNNYSSFANYKKLTLDQTVKYLETIPGAVESACWFWYNNGLNKLADENKFDTITQRINGGQNGAADRRNKFAKALTAIK